MAISARWIALYRAVAFLPQMAISARWIELYRAVAFLPQAVGEAAARSSFLAARPLGSGHGGRPRSWLPPPHDGRAVQVLVCPRRHVAAPGRSLVEHAGHPFMQRGLLDPLGPPPHRVLDGLVDCRDLYALTVQLVGVAYLGGGVGGQGVDNPAAEIG